MCAVNVSFAVNDCHNGSSVKMKESVSSLEEMWRRGRKGSPASLEEDK